MKRRSETYEANTMTPITHSQLTHKAGRDHNEDAVLTLNKDNHHLFVVADGMEGARGGEVASSITIEAIEEELKKESRQKNELSD